MMSNMKIKLYISFFFLFTFFLQCNEKWEEHYNDYPSSVDMNVWEALNQVEEISKFVQILEDNELDTLFQTGNTFTIFAPSNSAIDDFLELNEIDTTVIKYHISNHFIQSGNIPEKIKIKTYTDKYALLEQQGSELFLDGIPSHSESPLYRNGKFFILDEVATPLLNLYEFFAQNNKVLKNYIDSKDSILLDMENSVPIGYNDEDQTIFDSVTITINEFEEEYFKVSEEFRNKTATIVFPLEEQYNEALNVMAQKLGSGYSDFNDIPIIWQNEKLIPYLLDVGIFPNMLEPDDFLWRTANDTLKLKNIVGDSVKINYSVTDKTICSNGYAYNYRNFVIPDSLYNVPVVFEMESLVEEIGNDKYGWNEYVNQTNSIPLDPPYREYIPALKDSIVRVLFPNDYSGTYSLEFTTDYLFPKNYRMVVKTHMDYGGIYDVYVNNELVRTFDYYDFEYYGYILPGVSSGNIYDPSIVNYFPTGRFNSFDMIVENINTFSKAKIKFVYKGPGDVISNGLVIDKITFVPIIN